MKKILALALSFGFLALTALPAFAAEVDTVGGGQDIEVKAKYENTVVEEDSYSVEITWGAMEFTYSVAGSRVWDAAAHDYNVNETSQWQVSGNTVTVVNHSNVSIKADFKYTADAAYSGITGAFDKPSITLPSAVGVGTDAESLKTVTAESALTLDGTLGNSVTTLARVGKITVTISKASQQ